MKRKFKILASLFLISSFSLSSFACTSTNTEENKQATEIFAEIENASIQQYQSVSIELIDEISEIEWSSSAPNVAVVENGKIIGVSLGETVITAKVGKEMQTQKIIVSAPTSAPEIAIDSLSVLYGDTYEIDAQVYCGNILLDGVTYEYVSADSSVCRVESSLLKGVAYGETSVTITATWRGQAVATKTVPCKVNRNAAIYTDKDEYLVYTKDMVSGVAFSTFAEINAKVYYEDRVISDAVIEWETDNAEIATVSDKGVINYASYGETYLIGKCTVEGVELSTRKIPVKVEKPYANTQKDVLFDTQLGTVNEGVFNTEEIFGFKCEIGRVVELNNGVAYTTSNGTLDISEINSGEYRFAVYEKEEAFACELTVRIADYVVRTKSDLLAMGQYTTAYIVLANNLIDVGSFEAEYYNNSYIFEGTFDGAGHTISGIQMVRGNAGLFGYFAGTIKNVAVIGRTTYGNQGAFFYQSRKHAVIDNVYVDMTLNKGYKFSAALGGLCNGDSVTIKNSIVKAKTLGEDPTLDSTCGIIAGRMNTITLTLENAYFIGQGTLFATESDTVNNRAEMHNRNTDTWYATEEEFKADKLENKLDFSGFSHYWNITVELPTFAV